MRTLIVYEETAALRARPRENPRYSRRTDSCTNGGVTPSCFSRTVIFAAPAAGSIWRRRAPCSSPCATPARSGVRSSGLSAARCSRSCATRCSIRSSISAWPGRRRSSRSTHHADGWQRLPLRPAPSLRTPCGFSPRTGSRCRHRWRRTCCGRWNGRARLVTCGNAPSAWCFSRGVRWRRSARCSSPRDRLARPRCVWPPAAAWGFERCGRSWRGGRAWKGSCRFARRRSNAGRW